MSFHWSAVILLLLLLLQTPLKVECQKQQHAHTNWQPIDYVKRAAHCTLLGVVCNHRRVFVYIYNNYNNYNNNNQFKWNCNTTAQKWAINHFAVAIAVAVVAMAKVMDRSSLVASQRETKHLCVMIMGITFIVKTTRMLLRKIDPIQAKFLVTHSNPSRSLNLHCILVAKFCIKIHCFFFYFFFHCLTWTWIIGTCQSDTNKRCSKIV